MRKLALTNQKEDFGRTGKNWIEPLRSWILDIQKAKKLSQSDNFEDIKVFVQKVGTNHKLLDKSASFSFSAPWDYMAQFLASRASRRGEHFDLSPAKKLKSFELWTGWDLNQRPPLCHSGALPLSYRPVIDQLPFLFFFKAGFYFSGHSTSRQSFTLNPPVGPELNLALARPDS